MHKYQSRRIEATIRKSLETFPSVILTGPRQSGKTTLVRHLLSETHRYVTLDEPDVRLLARDDPRQFLRLHPPPVILDEIQYVPELLSYIKVKIDDAREQKGRYVLTGSQAFQLMSGVTESLAGRVAVHTLLPMAWGERLGVPRQTSPLNPQLEMTRASGSDGGLTDNPVAMARGGFPEPALDGDLPVRTWYASYIQTYLERDVRQIRQVADLEEFQRFMRALAARHGQLLNMAELGRDLGLALNTVKAWISVLAASHLIVLLRPYHRNMGKRLVKSARLYFLDSGLVCYLCGIQPSDRWQSGPMAGALFEGEVVGELTKWFYNRGETPALYSWRTAGGHEVDAVLEANAAIWPFEIKIAATLKSAMADGLKTFRNVFPDSRPGCLIHFGEQALMLADNVYAMPFSWVAGW